ncbi:MAG: thiamine pyrophosphate-dependent enzyme [Methanocellales archaeon]|nr:thiamine pyrophosphate-dependent enzyme [Methanocellales archaeon]MDD3292139.1 thiamine pyrophosphate-dependent enzyme [Methanocellales archaeon]MDD5235376.1 thiamine pyrophosphate-dependent enzyme [Methanocellales archaeon]MDD5485676.1 thiamine pyrophosphate-dependent enzyme [Methanocellales archaeon]
MSADLSTDAEITWCPGCGNFGIFNAFKKVVKKLEDKGVDRNKLIISSGIGCHGKIVDYIGLSGLYSIHGRSMATVQGIKLGNPDLKVLAFAGDGDAYSEGIAHMIFAAKRNADITVIVHNNGTYALTTGQFSPTSRKGFKGPSLPEGNIEEPLNPLSLLLEAGASFVARGYAGKIDHLSDLIVEAVLHEGFSVIDVLQPSVVFNNTYKLYNEITEIIPKPAKSFEEAVKLAKEMRDRMAIGVFYKVNKPVFHQELMGNWNPIRDKLGRKERLKKVEEFFQQ